MDQSNEIADTAAANVKLISNKAGAAGHAALGRIASSGIHLSADTANAWYAMQVIAAIGAVAFLLTRLMISRAVTRPLDRLCESTERLSEGNMDPIEGIGATTGEIARMAAALEVFRSNALNMEKLRIENVEQEQEAQRRQREMLTLLSTEIGSVVGAGSRGDFSIRVEHAFDDGELSSLATGVNQLLEAVDRGLSETRTALRSIAQADLTHRMPSDFEGVFGELSQDVNETSARLAEIIGNIRKATQVSATRGRQVSEGARGLSARAASQAASIEQTSATMDMMSDSIRSSAEALTEAEKLSSQVANKTSDGAKAADDAVRNVEQIAESSERITQINSVIEEIAFQTNLLALNAAVEAARAGDAGKGFAVVASEVRALAQRSSDAANEIGALVGRSVESVKAGVASVEATRMALRDIEKTTHPVIEAMSSVAENGRNQANSIAEIHAAIREIETVTQKNSEYAESSTRQAGDLLSQIDRLEKMVSEFRVLELRENDGRDAA